MWLQNLRNLIKIPAFGRYWRGKASRLPQTATKFPLYLSFTVHYFYTLFRSFTQFFIHKNCFEKFLSEIYIRNKWSLTSIARSHAREVCARTRVSEDQGRKEKRESTDYSTVQTWKHHLSLTCLHMFKSTSVTSKPSLTLDKPCTRKMKTYLTIWGKRSEGEPYDFFTIFFTY